ncbi:hypothetical protein TrVE_jg10780 [Triparma verrucosa]|uniref:Acyl-CoA thioesterase-like N-terminal HotDog domain-containing protein n=1 Tax=Triparma verrucosa TaxID=1606542 RepID=A0A9W7DQR9_9STRA|nr:hypothetical protein TrVE_jg10780 [Triparma verrucosa]
MFNHVCRHLRTTSPSFTTTKDLFRSFASAPPTPHPKLSVSQVSPGIFVTPKENLNVVFKPGAFGGQLMAQSLSSAINAAPSGYTPSSLQCFFLGPTLIDKDVYFTTSLLRESGKSFKTYRIEAKQLSDGDGDTLDDLPSKPLNFEATVSFYKTPLHPDQNPAISPHVSASPLSTSDFEASLSLSDVNASIKTGEISRRALYQMALKLTQSCTADMQLQIRLPANPPLNTGRTSYFIGVPADLISGSDLKTLIPYISDSMTQVLSACDFLDTVWKGWPSKLTVWNYSINYHTYSSEGSGYVDSSGIRWFVIDYVFAGAQDGVGNGVNNIWNLNGELLSTGSYQVLGSPPK